MKKIFLLLFFIISIFYLLFPSRAFLGDDLFYASAIENNDVAWIFRPFHLLYSSSWLPIYKLIKLVNPYIRSIYILTTLNSIVAVIGILLFYLMLKKITLDEKISLLSTFFLASSIGYWHQGTSAGVDTLEKLFLILCFFMLYKTTISDRKNDFLWMGITTGIAILYLNANILLIPIFLITYLFYKKTFKKEIFIFISSAIFIVLIAYLFVIFKILKFKNIGEIARWLYPNCIKDYVTKEIYLSPFYNLYAQLRTIFSLEPIKNLILKKYTPDVLSGLFFLLCAGFLGIYISIDFFRQFKTIYKNNRLLFLLSSSWIITYTLFFCWYSAGNMRFFVRNLIPLSICFGLLYLYSKRKKIYVLFVIFLFLGNFLGQILPYSNPKNTEELKFAEFIQKNITKDSLILMPATGESNLSLILEYFYKIKIASLRYGLTRRKEEFKRLIEDYLILNKPVYVISDFKKVTSALVIKTDERRPEFSPEGKIFQDFLKENNYRLSLIIEYKDTPNYSGNKIYRLIKNE